MRNNFANLGIASAPAIDWRADFSLGAMPSGVAWEDDYDGTGAGGTTAFTGAMATLTAETTSHFLMFEDWLTNLDDYDAGYFELLGFRQPPGVNRFWLRWLDRSTLGAAGVGFTAFDGYSATNTCFLHHVNSGGIANNTAKIWPWSDSDYRIGNLGLYWFRTYGSFFVGVTINGTVFDQIEASDLELDASDAMPFLQAQTQSGTKDFHLNAARLRLWRGLI